MALWTLIADFRGGTYIAQCRADTMLEALEWYAAERPHVEFLEFEPGSDFFKPVPVDMIQSVWCTSVFETVDADLVMLHIVKTEESCPNDKRTQETS